jgi:transposase-like protein
MSTKSVKLAENLLVNSLNNRSFSEEFKRQKIKELDANVISISQICELYGVSRTSVYKWRYAYSIHYQKQTKIVVQMESEALKTLQLTQRLAELERIIGQKQMEIDYLNKVIEIAGKTYEADLKKNFVQEASNGFVRASKTVVTE